MGSWLIKVAENYFNFLVLSAAPFYQIEAVKGVSDVIQVPATFWSYADGILVRFRLVFV